MTSRPLYVRIPAKVDEALRAYAEEKGHTLSRAACDLLTAALVSEELPGALPHEVQGYLFGRRMFAIVSGLADAAAAANEEHQAES